MSNKTKNKPVKKQMSMEWEKKEPSIEVPPAVFRKSCEEFAERVRDGVNSHSGHDRLTISSFYQYTPTLCAVLYEDTEAPEGSDRLVIDYEMDVDVDGAIDVVLNGQPGELEVGDEEVSV